MGAPAQLLSMGYTGGMSVSPQVYQNPLQALPSPNIVMTNQEVNSVSAQMGMPMWHLLNPGQQKIVAARVLQNRGTPQSKAQAGQVLLSNPAYQVFTIIYGAAAL
jgi:hypothetical protein